jgi:hypothetical protein
MKKFLYGSTVARLMAVVATAAALGAHKKW